MGGGRLRVVTPGAMTDEELGGVRWLTAPLMQLNRNGDLLVA